MSHDPSCTPSQSEAPDSVPTLDSGDAADGGTQIAALGAEQIAETAPSAESVEALPAAELEPSGGTPDADAADKKRRRRKKRKSVAGPDGASEPPLRPTGRAHEWVPFRVGEQVFGKVTTVLEEAIMVDLSGKALGIFDRAEMAVDDLMPQVGDSFVAEVHNDGGRGGCVVLSRRRLREEDIKPIVEEACREGLLVKGLVTGTIKGGVEVDIYGLRAFAPASGMDLHPANANLATLVGQRLEFKVIQYDKSGRDVVVTRRPMLEAEAHERRKHALTLLKEDQVMQGIVRTVVDWGMFVALPEAENLEGLVHASEASHDQHSRLTDLFKPGDQVQVQITKIDDKGKIWLSRKALIDHPWASAREKYALLSRHEGVVKSLESFGAFIELEPGVEGLLHTADLDFDGVEHPKDKLKVGDRIPVVVAHLDTSNQKLALHPALSPEHADEPPQKVAKNNAVKVEIVKIESLGLVVRVLGVTGRAARGYIPASQTGKPRGAELRKSFKQGSHLEAKIIDMDPRRGEPKLSIRGLAEDEERRAAKEYRQKLKAESSFGTLGDLFRNKLASVPPPDKSSQDESTSSE
jgi:small subunit ribosomal protein S1